MTPSAITPAGRHSKHARKPHQAHPPKVPRRVSGPVTGRDLPSAAPGTVPSSRTHRRPGPTAPPPGSSRAVIGMRASAFVRTLPDRPLLDRVVRGRAWIALLGVMLAGIVAMQVEVLGLGASMGRAIERTTVLQSRNEMLRASVASLSDQQRIERRAAGMGMVMPPPDAIGFLAADHGATAPRAAASIHVPNPAAFAAALPKAGGPGAAGAASTGASSTAGTTSTAGAASTGATQSPTSAGGG